MRRTIVAVCVLLSTPLIAADPFTSELKRYVRDAKDLSVAPLHWDRNEWIRFSEGAAAVAFLYATDRQTYDAVQRNRSSFSNRFAKDITPFGGHRSEEISVLLIAAGALIGRAVGKSIVWRHRRIRVTVIPFPVVWR